MAVCSHELNIMWLLVNNFVITKRELVTLNERVWFIKILLTKAVVQQREIPQSFQTVTVAIVIIGASDRATEYVNKLVVVRNEYDDFYVRTVLRMFVM